MNANSSRQRNKAPVLASAKGLRCLEGYTALQKCPITVHEFAGIKSCYLDTREVANLMSALMGPLASLKVSWQVEGH